MQKTISDFWPWFLKSARPDGVASHSWRRALSAFLTVTIFMGWAWWWTAKHDPLAVRAFGKLFFHHPVCGAGLVLAFFIMGGRNIALDYLAYRVYAQANLKVSRGVFTTGKRVLLEYQKVFGPDKYSKAPEFIGFLAVLIGVISGFALVFSSK